MNKEKTYYNLSERKLSDCLLNKIIQNQMIFDFDFSERSLEQVDFLNCMLTFTGFIASKFENVLFENCFLQSISFRKADFENCSFKNCQLNSVDFGRCDLIDCKFANCKLNEVYLNATELTDFKIDNSQLENVCFSGAILDNVKIKNSTLEKIECNGVIAIKEFKQNGVVNVNRIPIQTYSGFLNEISESLTENNNLVDVADSNESFQSILNFFTLITGITYCFLKPEIFDFLSKYSQS